VATSGGTSGGGGPGPIASGSIFWTVLGDASGVAGLLEYTTPFDPTAGAYGTVAVSNGYPSTAYALGAAIVTFGGGQIQLSAASPTENYEFAVSVIIASADGLSVLVLAGSQTVPATGLGPIDFAATDFDATVVAGTDLVWDSTTGTVISTAGGVYGVQLVGATSV
jgi:hypothetical protein